MTSRPKRIIFILTGILIILGVAIHLFWDILTLQYYNIKNNHAKVNDKLYAADWMKASGHNYHLKLYRIAQNTAGDKMAVDGGWEINSDSLAKHNSNFIGYYKDYKIINSEFGIKMLYYEIGANKLGLERINYENEISLPKGFTFTNEHFHVICFEVSDKQ